jgi:hypothetical protein
MKLRDLLQQLKEVQEKLGIAPAYLCGGTPRDKYMNQLQNLADLDITNGTKSCDYLAQEFYLQLRKQYNVSHKMMTDHSTIFIGSLKLDFSSNFNVPNIEQILIKKGITQPTDLQKEIYSRDFTCNSLLMTLDLKNIMDPTKRGFADIKEKKIRTCLTPEITLTSNRNRVVRAIYLACKLGFDLDNSIIEYVRKNPQTVKISTPKSMAEKLGEAFTRDGDKASYLLTKMDLWNQVPIVQPAYTYYQKHLQSSSITHKSASKKCEKCDCVKEHCECLKDNNDGRNFDYGTGLYENMDKYDSVKEFIDKSPLGYGRPKPKRDVNHIDFVFDTQREDSAEEGSILGDSESFEKPTDIGPAVGDIPNDGVFPGTVGLGDFESYPYSAQIGGLLDRYLPQNDFENKDPSQLDFGRDYETEDNSPSSLLNDSDLEELSHKYLTPAETDLFGLPDGIDPPSDLDAEETIQTENPDYGITDSGRQMYEDKWNI